MAQLLNNKRGTCCILGKKPERVQTILQHKGVGIFVEIFFFLILYVEDSISSRCIRGSDFIARTFPFAHQNDTRCFAFWPLGT